MASEPMLKQVLNHVSVDNIVHQIHLLLELQMVKIQKIKIRLFRFSSGTIL